jgi:hypothetical protein
MAEMPARANAQLALVYEDIKIKFLEPAKAA